MHILWTIIIGLLAGALARFIVPGKDPGGVLVSIILGIVGALVATFLGKLLGLYQPGESASSLGLTGRERYEVIGIAQSLKPAGTIAVAAYGDGDKKTEFQTIARIDTPEELVAFRHGGILPYVLRQLVGKH